ncbi:unnamed protein product [Calicophoron daubneyi]|uniref:Uncharacterized protein n=1 Tax=Calicophoron daubneyi TaxID=300641 RepID=A0AAV2T398_CALDB
MNKYGIFIFRPPIAKFILVSWSYSDICDVLFSILEWSHVVRGNSEYSAELIATRSKNLLISIELVFTAIALRYAFPYSIYVLHRPPRLVLDLQLDGQEWPGSGKFESLPVNGKSHKSAHSIGKDPQSVRTDLLYGTPLFTDRPVKGEREPLPWDIADPTVLDDDAEQTVWDSQNPTTLPSISASIKATIDPRDILVDAIHNFHPNYRHYTQTRMDENT